MQEEARAAGPAASAASTGSAAAGGTEQAGSSAVAALADYAIAVLEFEIACINTWIHRRIAAAAAASGDAAAAAEAAVKAVPCIRFCMDFKSNAKLAATGCKAAELVRMAIICYGIMYCGWLVVSSWCPTLQYSCMPTGWIP